MDIQEILKERDAMEGVRSDAEIEQWLKDTCAAFAAAEPDDCAGQSALCNELGNFYNNRGRLAESEAAFLEAKSLLEELRSIKILTTEQLGGCCCCRGGVDLDIQVPCDAEQEPHVEYVLTNFTETGNYATTLCNLAGVYRLEGKLDEAQETFETAMKIYDLLEDVPADIYAGCCNNMGLVYLERKDYSTAAQCFDKALATLGDDPAFRSDRATTLHNAAIAAYFAGDTPAALEKLNRAAEDFAALGEEGDEMRRMCLDLIEKIGG